MTHAMPNPHVAAGASTSSNIYIRDLTYGFDIMACQTPTITIGSDEWETHNVLDIGALL